jgi:hypothetical protein
VSNKCETDDENSEDNENETEHRNGEESGTKTVT